MTENISVSPHCTIMLDLHCCEPDGLHAEFCSTYFVQLEKWCPEAEKNKQKHLGWSGKRSDNHHFQGTRQKGLFATTKCVGKPFSKCILAQTRVWPTICVKTKRRVWEREWLGGWSLMSNSSRLKGWVDWVSPQTSKQDFLSSVVL